MRYYFMLLIGTDINIYTGEWINFMSGVGAGQDSFYEYLLKVGSFFKIWW